MPVNIIKDEDQGYAALYCTTTMWAFGGVFYLNEKEDPWDFLDWLETACPGREVRELSDKEVEGYMSEWRSFNKGLRAKLEAWGLTDIDAEEGLWTDKGWVFIVTASFKGNQIEFYKNYVQKCDNVVQLLKHCGFTTCCGDEATYSDWVDSRRCPTCKEHW